MNSYVACDIVDMYLSVGVAFKRLVSKAPYLVHHSSKAPHITGSGVLLEMKCLRCISLSQDFVLFTVQSYHV